MHRTLSTLTLLLVLSGCSTSSEDAPDPTAAEVLRKAEPLRFGCAFTRRERSSYGSASSDKSFPECREQALCDSLREPERGFAYAGGSAWTSSTTYEDRVTFIGSCGDHEVVKETGTCALAARFCVIDPNCIAIRDCALDCADDEACVGRCVDNGESFASQNLIQSAKCVEIGVVNEDLEVIFSVEKAGTKP